LHEEDEVRDLVLKLLIVSTKITTNLSINSVVVKLGRILLAGPLEATQNGT
jgi:hypothetical protein